MALFHWSTIFKATTVPANPAIASIRQGGWSEGFWTEQPTNALLPFARTLWTQRAQLLGTSCSITGYRVQEYAIAGNKLLPLGAVNGRLNYPGAVGRPTDIPQLALSIDFTGVTRPNTASTKLGAFPDQWVSGGEFNGLTGSIGFLDLYLTALKNLVSGFVGRDLSLGTTRVNSVATGANPNEFTLSTAGDVPGLATGDYVRFLRSYTDTKLPIKGAFRVTRLGVGSYTVYGKLPGTNPNPSGLVRKDIAVFVEANKGTVGKAEIKKIGRPIGGFRGRASKKR